MAAASLKKWHPATVWILRLILGAVFIASGMAKSIDPWGSMFKIEEYLQVLGFILPRTVILAGALALSWGEFLLGSLLALGCYRRVAVWLMSAVMAVMLPLTAWIMIADPVADCGCFGDAWVIDNTSTFIKNVIIAAMLVPLWMWNSRVKGLFTPYSQWLTGALLTLFICTVSMFGYNVQPLVDFRRFAAGTALVIPDDGTETNDDEADITYMFIYEKNGERREFSEDTLPDSTWTFVDRRLTGGNESAGDDFVILEDGQDITRDVIATEGEQLLVVVTDIGRVTPGHTFAVNELSGTMHERGASVTTLIAGDGAALDYWHDISMNDDPVYSAEPTLLKELVRGNIAVVGLRDGRVEWKRTLPAVDTDSLTDRIDEYRNYPGHRLAAFSAMTLIILALLWAADRAGLLIWLRIKRHPGATTEK